MGYYQDLFNKILQVEGQGFNPYTDNYGASIARLDAQSTQVPQAGESASNGSILSENVTKEPTLSETFTQAGYDDPFANILTETGELNLPSLSAGYNIALQDKSLGVEGSAIIDQINKLNKADIENYYGEGRQLVVNPDNSLGISELPPKKDMKYTFEKGVNQSTGKPIYYRWEGESGSEKYVTYKTEEEYDKARLAEERDYDSKGIQDYEQTIKKK